MLPAVGMRPCKHDVETRKQQSMIQRAGVIVEGQSTLVRPKRLSLVSLIS